MLRLVSLLGVFVLLGLCYALSRDRRAVSWRLVGMGMLVQVVLGGLFLYWDAGNHWLRDVGQSIKHFLDLAQRGTEFVFGDLGRSSSPDDLYLYESADGVHFGSRGPFAFGASQPTIATAAGGTMAAVFRWPAPDLPASLAGLGVRSRALAGGWSATRPVDLRGMPADLQSPFDPCLAALPGGGWRLYFAAVRGLRGRPQIYSARSSDGVAFELEPGVRFATDGGIASHPAVARLGAVWHLWVPRRDRPGTAFHATSPDGLQFTPAADAVLQGAGAWCGSAVATAFGVRFFGSGWSARSADGEHWQLESGLDVRDGNQVVQPLDPGVQVGGGSYAMLIPGRPGMVFVFATQILPTLIFFSAFMAVLYHLGVMQWIVRGMAVVMARLLGTSGAESLSACGNIFVGQTEAPLMVRPFLPRMTGSELHAVMTGGFATIAGGVFALYVGFGIDPGHLLVASVMAAPAGLVCSKLLWPETETSETMGKVVTAGARTAGNVVEAAANGALDGLRLALNVGAMLVAFLGLVAVLDLVLGSFGALFSYDGLSVGRVLGWVFWPVAAVMGVPSDDVLPLGELLGTKIALTELVAYQQLGVMKQAGTLAPRTILIASFALCGFANVGSVAIQIGGLGAMAPERKGDLARMAFRAMFAGAIATCVTACLAGVMTDG